MKKIILSFLLLSACPTAYQADNIRACQKACHDSGSKMRSFCDPAAAASSYVISNCVGCVCE